MTTFAHYWGKVQRAMPALLLISAGAAVVAWLIVRDLGPTYEVHYSYLISLSQRDTVSDYRFDGFYALQATDLFAATLAQWMRTPEVIVAAYRAADLPLPSSDPRTLTRRVATDKTAPQLVQVTVKDNSQPAAEQLAEGLMAVMDKNINTYHDQAIPAVQFRTSTTEPWTGQPSVSAPLVVVATFVFVLLLSVNGLLLIESLKKM